MTIMVTFLTASTAVAAEVQTEKLTQPVSRAANQLAAGNAEAALYSAVPRANFRAAQTNVGLNRNLIRVNQAIKPVNQLGGRYLNTSANVNATAYVQPAKTPVVTPSAQFHAGNKYLSNTTTFKKD